MVEFYTMKILKTILKIIIVAIKVFVSMFVLLTACYYNFLVIVHTAIGKVRPDFQIVFYVLLAVFLILSALVAPFIMFTKLKKYDAIIYLSLTILFFTWLFSPRFLPSVMYIFNTDSCIDTGICVEGLKTKMDGNVVEVVNKENCLKHGKAWDEKHKWCDLRSKEEHPQ